jgi:UPF0755 protein
LQSKWVPKRKLKGLFLGLFVVLIIFLALVGGVLFWYKINTSPTKPGEEKVVVIQKGESTSQIADKLAKNGLIRDSLAFRIYIRLNNLKPNIQAGTFKIKSGLSIEQILQNLAVGRLDKWVTIQEGLRVEEIANILSKEFPIKEADFLKLAKEGYMFPDTYLLPIDATAAKAASILEENFNKKVDTKLRERITASGLSLNEAIVLASIVERDSSNGPERPTVAGIYLKRLNEGWRLESDATVQYALGYDEEQKTWWRNNLTDEELSVDSPYNTRVNSGLPPAPICSPGLIAIKAVLESESSPYYYYLYDKDGKVHFAKTLDEHNANVAKYIQ